ncbi:sodium/glutamate symporter [uncultured Dialister sp.]|uniref:sodium/glutamate symporter n=2 Tax=uncultured Dialister sp. TaxID=278064 RepID=UPI0025D4088B|nr:sodium/glutamate symporter [uncultured Dialister sp.]
MNFLLWEKEMGANSMDINLNMYQTLAAAVAVFFLGGFLKTKIKFLRKYCIPAPVIGGTIFSIVNCILYTKGLWTYTQDTVMQNWCMMLFFTSIGYMASVKLIKKGGILVIKMAVLVGILIIIQNCIGISLSHVFHENPLMGLADGSIPLVGGHGTSGSFGPVLEKLGLPDATTIAFAAATFGLVAGSFIGGPIGELLIRHFHLFSTETDESSSTLDGGKINKHPETEDDEDAAANYLNMDNFMYAFGQLLLAMGLGTYVSQFFVDIGLVFPGYIGAMIVAAVIRNVAEGTKLFGIYQKESEVLGGMCLNIFLSCALMSLKLWQLADLAVPLIVTLLIQTVVMALFAYFVIFRVMGRNYEAAVMASGTCGFGMGATPNAIANMNAMCERFGPAHTAYFVIPLIGAFVVDFLNASILMVFMNLLK